MPSNMRNEALAQEQPAHAHPPAKEVTGEKQITERNPWWSRWGRSKATDQVPLMFIQHLTSNTPNLEPIRNFYIATSKPTRILNLVSLVLTLKSEPNPATEKTLLHSCIISHV